MVLSTQSAVGIVGIPVLILLLAHGKSLPLAFSIRIRLLIRSLTKRAKAQGWKPEPLFTAVSQDYKCLCDDIDHNQHMNNSTYNKMLDFGRIHVLYTVLPYPMIDTDNRVFVLLGGSVTLYKKEIRPLSTYRIWTRIWTWNTKWLMFQHRFLLPSGEIACMAISKLIFKKTSGKTVPPAQVLEHAGHDVSHPAIEERRQKNWELAESLLKLDALENDPYDWNAQQLLLPAKL